LACQGQNIELLIKTSSQVFLLFPLQLLCMMWSHTHTEDAAEHSKTALGAFLDIEVTFVSTSFKTVTKTAEQHGIGSTICRWVGSMLGSRAFTATLPEKGQQLSA